MISNNGKYIKNTGVYHGFEKNETATMFFLKKPSLVGMYNLIILTSSICLVDRYEETPVLQNVYG